MPVLIDSPLELGLGGGDFVGVWRCVVVVVGMGGDAVQVDRVCLLAAFCEEPEVF